MSLLPQDATFEERVQDCFAAFRGSGVMLSALDAALGCRWADEGIPFEVVARGIRRAAEAALWDARPGEPAVQSLRACRRAVQEEIKKHLGRSAGRRSSSVEADSPLDATAAVNPLGKRHEKLRAALRRTRRDDPGLAPTIDRLLRGPLGAAPGNLAEAGRREDAVHLALVRALPFPARLALLRGARALELGGSPCLSVEGRRMSRRFHRAALLRKRIALPTFW